MAVAAPRPQKKRKGSLEDDAGSNLTRIIGYTVLGIMTLVYVGPILWLLISSVKPNTQVTSDPPVWIPDPFTTESFSRILDNPETPAFRWFFNSLFAASVHTLLTLVTASLAAYALARMDFPGKRFIFGTILSTLFIPGIILTIPLYIVVDRIGWIDTIWALAVPLAAGAFGIFFLRQFFSSLPKELEEAAFVDGANRWQIFTKVILPLAKPPLATLAVVSFLANWNEFLWPVYSLLSPQSQTLQPGLSTLQSAATTDYAIIMAGATIATVPVLLLYLFSQRYIIEGVSRSGLKG
jgi:multiple sugar transport system permease protein